MSTKDILVAVREESGTQVGHCPVCDSAAFDEDFGVCEDCGTDVPADFACGFADTVFEDRA